MLIRSAVQSFHRPVSRFGLAVLLLFFAFSPGAISSQGYNVESILFGEQLHARLAALASGAPASAIDMPRHGLLGVLLDVPFLIPSLTAGSAAAAWSDRFLSLQPILLATLLLCLLFVWARRLTGSEVWGYVLGLAAGFSTLLWPYAYIGLETTQSLALLLAGYLALGRKPERSRREMLLFAVSCGVAVSVKINGVLLGPVVGWLVLCYFDCTSPRRLGRLREHRRAIIQVVAVVGAIFLLNAYARTFASLNRGGIGGVHLFVRMVGSPLTYALHLYSFIASPNKGLIVYAPPVLLGLVSLGRAWRASSSMVVFALLTLFGLAGGFALSYIWAEETWGPRYLHAAVAPLMLCFALTRRRRPFVPRREWPLLSAMAVGLPISLLGVMFYYGTLHGVLVQCGQPNLETMQYNIHWNHIRFNLELTRVWLDGAGGGAYWPPQPHWWFVRPPNAPEHTQANLRPFAVPQPTLLRRPAATPGARIIWGSHLVALLLGLTLLIRQGAALGRAGVPETRQAVHFESEGGKRL